MRAETPPVRARWRTAPKNMKINWKKYEQISCFYSHLHLFLFATPQDLLELCKLWSGCVAPQEQLFCCSLSPGATLCFLVRVHSDFRYETWNKFIFHQYISVFALLCAPGDRIGLVGAQFEVGCQSQKSGFYCGKRYDAGRTGKVRCSKKIAQYEN